MFIIYFRRLADKLRKPLKQTAEFHSYTTRNTTSFSLDFLSLFLTVHERYTVRGLDWNHILSAIILFPTEQ